MKKKFDPKKLRSRRQSLGITSNRALAKLACISRSTLQEMLRTGEATENNLNAVMKALKISEQSLQLSAVINEKDEQCFELPPPHGWTVDSIQSPVLTAANGVRYQVAKLRKDLLPNRFVRGKFYDLLHVATAKLPELSERLIRHAQVCLQLANQPMIAKHVDIRPMGNNTAWWMFDEWVDSTPLATLMDSGSEFDLGIIQSIGADLLEGLASLHQHKIIVRELAPERILLVDNTRKCLITDFELAKMLNSEISVSGEWKCVSPYRAPEVRDDDPHTQSDLYSWSIVMTEMMTGRTEADRVHLFAATKDDSIAKLLVKCADVRYHHRPFTAELVLKQWNNWKPR